MHHFHNHFTIRTNTTSTIERKSGDFFYILCKIRRKVVDTSSSVYLSPTHISVQSVFFYLQSVSKTLVPSSPSGTKTFLRGTKSTFRQKSVVFTPGSETSVRAIWRPQLLNVYKILQSPVQQSCCCSRLGVKSSMTLSCCRYF